MADVTLTYKGSDILELSNSGSATLKTGGKYCEDDIAVEYVKPSGGGDPYEMLLAVNNNTATSISLDGVTEIKEYMFYGCSNLTSFNFSNITKINSSAFYGTGLTGTLFFDKPLIIQGNGIFRNTKISTAVFKSANRFEMSEFEGCSLLEKVDAFITSIFTINSTPFTNTASLKVLVLRQRALISMTAALTNTCGLKANSDAKVYVPSSLVSTYQNATNWSTIADKITAIEGSYYETHYADGTVIS